MQGDWAAWLVVVLLKGQEAFLAIRLYPVLLWSLKLGFKKCNIKNSGAQKQQI